MYSLVAGIYDSYLAPTQLNLLIVGAPGVGKTALLERLKVTQIPKRPSKKPEMDVSNAVDMPQPLRQAFIEGGAKADDQPITMLNSSNNDVSQLAGTQQRPPQQQRLQQRSNNHTPKKKALVQEPPSPIVVTQKTNRKSRIFNAICPAPERYRNTAVDSDEEFVFDSDDDLKDLPPDNDEEEQLEDYNTQLKPESSSSFDNDDPIPTTTDTNGGSSTPVVAPRRVRCHSKEMMVNQLDLVSPMQPIEADYDDDDFNNDRRASMEDIPITPSIGTATTTSVPKGGGVVVPLPQLSTIADTSNGESSANVVNVTTPTKSTTKSSLHQPSKEEYNVKSNSKMLPLVKIRPTIGTNLTKIDCFGAKCSIFDVGGKMRNLWERYYDDCDAVVFCWKLGDDPDADEDGDGEGDSDNDEDEKPFDLSQQQEILNEVRQAISDDVPFLIFGHIFGSADPELTSKQYSTNPVMPRYHNPLCGLVCGSAKTGAGVVSAMEWLIPLAKRQQKERLQQKEQNKKI